MSQQNVELVRTIYAVWTGRQGANKTLAYLAEDVEYVNPHYALEPGTRYGHAGWLKAMGNLEAAFHDHDNEVHEVRDLGDRVLAFTTFVVQTTPDGPAFRQDESHLWSFRDGKVIRLQWFHDRAEALAAAELQE